jgi:high-affinity iron transporter
VLPTFVIGLREGVEASLIVGIVAAFLKQRDARRAMKWVWAGVVLAIALCTGVAIVLEIVNENLPQREQERLETVIALIAVAMVTSMIVWMTRHARGLRGELEQAAGSALAEGSAWALVGMAFLAVLREGLETAVFLLSTFQASTNRTAAVAGAVLGILLAVVIGWGIYRGGVRIDLGRFFMVTGLVLVLVAAGLVAFAAHTAHEAGWLNVAQDQFVDLSGVIKPGSVPSALVTGVLGIQPKPTVAEAVGWLAYFVPVTAFVLLSARRKRPQPREEPAMASAT